MIFFVFSISLSTIIFILFLCNAIGVFLDIWNNSYDCCNLVTKLHGNTTPMYRCFLSDHDITVLVNAPPQKGECFIYLCDQHTKHYFKIRINYSISSTFPNQISKLISKSCCIFLIYALFYLKIYMHFKISLQMMSATFRNFVLSKNLNIYKFSRHRSAWICELNRIRSATWNSSEIWLILHISICTWCEDTYLKGWCKSCYRTHGKKSFGIIFPPCVNWDLIIFFCF